MYNKIKNLTDGLRPIISESHDFSASFFKNKESNKPLFQLSSRGSFKIDVFKALSVFLVVITTLSAFSLSSEINRNRKNKIRRMKAELRSIKNLKNKTI